MSDLIKKNLATFTSLLLGQKLEFDKNKGLFSISKAGLFQGLHRTNDDSINLLKLQIIKVFQEAEKKNIPFIHALYGINTLRLTYGNNDTKKKNVNEIIVAVENLSISFMNAASEALTEVRNQIKWSANKRYQDKSDITKITKKLLALANAEINVLPNLIELTKDERSKFINDTWKNALSKNKHDFQTKLHNLRTKVTNNIVLTVEEKKLMDKLESEVEPRVNKARNFAFDDLVSFGVGNCGEMAQLAFNFLKKKNVSVAKLSLGFGESVVDPLVPVDPRVPKTIFKGDHAFLLVGHNFHGYDVNGKILPTINKESIFYKDVKDFKNAYICDPWANIVCPVTDYPSQWELKMQKWSGLGKFIFYKDKVIDPYTNSNYKQCIPLCQWIPGYQYFRTK